MTDKKKTVEEIADADLETIQGAGTKLKKPATNMEVVNEDELMSPRKPGAPGFSSTAGGSPNV